MIGEVVGSYRLTSELGAGGMGAVWLAEHTLLGSRAAIKVLRPELSQDQSIVQRFFDEARAASRVNHPNIVTVIDFGWQDGKAFLVMEHLVGETLTRAIHATGRIEPARALQLVREAAAAMGAAHAVGIVHRDLKPDNLFVVPDPVSGERVKVLDFGIAKLLVEGDSTHGLTQTGMIMGTPAYMSPEQCRGAGRVDHRTDIYALGCVLFHMLTGRVPFVASTPGDLIACHLTVPPPAPSSVTTGISLPLDALVARCLAKELDHRLGSMADLVAGIDELLQSPSLLEVRAATVDPATAPVTAAAAVPVTATTMRSSAGESRGRAPSTWRGGVIVAAFVLVGAVIAVVAFVSTTDQGPHATAPGADAAVTQPIDASPPDAAVAAAPPDAGSASVPGKKRVPPPRPPSGSGVPHAGSAGSAGSAGDLYDNR